MVLLPECVLASQMFLNVPLQEDVFSRWSHPITHRRNEGIGIHVRSLQLFCFVFFFFLFIQSAYCAYLQLALVSF